MEPRKDDGHHNWPWSTFNGYSPLMNDGSIPFLAFSHSVAPRPFCVIDLKRRKEAEQINRSSLIVIEC